MRKFLSIAALLLLGQFLLTALVDECYYGQTNPDIKNDPDFNNDGIVDFLDFKMMSDNWLCQEQPGTYQTDIDLNGSVDFNDFAIFAGKWLYKKDSVAVFIDLTNYSSLQSEIERLRNDIENDLGVRVFIFADDWEDITAIKNILKENYSQNGLLGAIFIGEIPTAYFEYQNSGSMPSDWYFQDLSDTFIDTDGDGKFEREYYIAETDITMREIWTGRLKPPLGGREGVEMLRNYLERNHKYRTDGFEYPEKMLYFGSVAINQNGTAKQEYFNLINQIDDFTGLYETEADVNAVYDTSMEIQKQIYLAELAKSYEFVFVNIHGSALTQWLGGSINIYYDEIKKAKPDALFSVLASCSNGDFTQENYFAGWYLFSGNSLVVMGNTVVTMLVGADSPEFLKDYIPLGLGVTFGEMYKNDSSFLVSDMFGDPTLTMRPKPAGEVSHMIITQNKLQFSDTQRGMKETKYVSFENKGSAKLKVKFKKGCFSINGKWENLGYWDVFYYEHPETGSSFRDFEVQAGKSKFVPFVFYPREDAPDGKYSMTMLFQTNDAENPYLEIRMTGNAY
ncbi:MAG: hypothetical protein JW787_04810 [Sedimentisphaerales bacterium]|nr:hypothetical protein [Sedimentisphaerales bacterium]